MAKFHINNAGEAGQCRATQGGCPFGGEAQHYDNPDAARKAYESSMESSQFPTASKRVATEAGSLARFDHYSGIEKGEWRPNGDPRLPNFRGYTDSEIAAAIADGTEVYKNLATQNLGPKGNAALDLIRRSLNPRTTPRGKVFGVSPDGVLDGLKSAIPLIEKVNPLAADELKKASERISKMRRDTSN